MRVNISEALGRLPRQVVGIPELSGARAAVEKVVHIHPNSPASGQRELHIAKSASIHDAGRRELIRSRQHRILRDDVA